MQDFSRVHTPKKVGKTQKFYDENRWCSGNITKQRVKEKTVKPKKTYPNSPKGTKVMREEDREIWEKHDSKIERKSASLTNVMTWSSCFTY